MNQQLQEKCDLFIRNKEALAKPFKWESSYLTTACSMLFTEKGETADSEKLAECENIVKKGAGVFSYFRGTVKPVLLSKMALSDDPKSYFDRVDQIYTLIKKNKLPGTEYTALTAMVIADNDSVSDVEILIKDIKKLYDGMAKNHPFLTYSEDVTFAALLVMSELSNETVLSEMENCYKLLKHKFSASNALQTLSHILALDSRDTQIKCNEVIDLFELLKSNKKKYDSNSFSILGALTMLGVEKEQLVSDILEVDSFLKNQKGFGILGIGEKQRLLYATSIVMNYYTAEENNVQASVLTSSVALTIAQEMAMLLTIAAANAAAAASSSSN